MKTNKNKTVNDNRQAIAGVQKHFTTTPTLVLDGTPTTPKDVIATLQGAIDTVDQAATAEKAFHDAVAVQNAAVTKANALFKALKMLVHNQLGSSEAILGDSGLLDPRAKCRTRRPRRQRSQSERQRARRDTRWESVRRPR
jgi:hypothetical protein